MASLARPGGNITGLSLGDLREFQGKRLELLRQAVPRISRVAFLWNPADPGNARQYAGMEAAAKPLRVTLESVELRAAAELDDAYATIVRRHVDALVVPAGPLLFGQRRRIAELSARTRIPAMYESAEFAEAGGLISYGPSLPEMFRRAASYVDRILRGAKPGDLPVEQSRKFELVINAKTAKALGLTIPQSLLLRADEVIQ